MALRYSWEVREIDKITGEFGVADKGKEPFVEGLDEETARLIASAPALKERVGFDAQVIHDTFQHLGTTFNVCLDPHCVQARRLIEEAR